MTAEQQRHDINDKAWEKIRPHTIGEKGTRGGNARDTRNLSTVYSGYCVLEHLGGTCQRRMETGKMYTAGSAGGVTRESGKRFWRPWGTTLTLSG